MNATHGGRTFHILLVEDNLEDVILTKTCLATLPYSITVHHAANGEECLQFLNKHGSFAEAPPPDLILLDLNMPRMDGREVMAQIASHPQFRRLPVVILTTSAVEEDLQKMYDLRCSAYVVKPLDFEPFQAMLKSLADFWFAAVALPQAK